MGKASFTKSSIVVMSGILMRNKTLKIIPFRCQSKLSTKGQCNHVKKTGSQKNMYTHLGCGEPEVELFYAN